MEHYYSPDQKSRSRFFKINIHSKHDNFELYSDSGVFSKKELDTGTKLLIENCLYKGRILDMGCGYGVVGISILRKNPDASVSFSDVNERALKLTKKNLEFHVLKGKIIKSNLFENLSGEFDTILSNPPMAAGREICFKLIEDSMKHLKKEGTLQIVARHNKGGSVLKNKMLEVFSNVEDLAKGSGFRVYISKKK